MKELNLSLNVFVGTEIMALQRMYVVEDDFYDREHHRVFHRVSSYDDARKLLAELREKNLDNESAGNPAVRRRLMENDVLKDSPESFCMISGGSIYHIAVQSDQSSHEWLL